MRILPETRLSEIPSVGEKRGAALARLNLSKVEDILFFYPRRYIDLRNFKKISMLVPGEMASVRGRVVAREQKSPRRRNSFLSVAISDNSGAVLFLVFFNQPYLKNVFSLEKEFFISGRVDLFRGKMQMVNPLYEEWKKESRDWILPVYPLSAGLTQKYMRGLVKFIMQRIEEYPREILPFKDRQRIALPNMKFSVSNIHLPRSDINLEKAKNYLIFREFLILQLGLLIRKAKRQKGKPVFDMKKGERLIGSFQSFLPFDLTRPQKTVMQEILEDITQGRTISRLIHGEVGSGKTVVAVFALWVFARMGLQAALLSPTEILAEQHYLNWHAFFQEQDIPVSILLGQMSEGEKKAVAEDIKNGKTSVVIGTHALLSGKLEFKNLKMAVIDEQHKFGVKQRETLKSKGEDVHFIVMSATPIPRSIALTFFGSLDVSTMGELPKGERKVATYISHKDEKDGVYRFLESQHSQGKQGYVVAPAIESSEDIQSAVEEYDKIKKELPGVPAGLIHGKLPNREKDEVMKRFRNKEISVLVATTVIESGIDVPEASYIIIEQAERFGLAQLHQLRGRVGRAGDSGCCILVPYTDKDESATERIENFAGVESGFDIAELDLTIRGHGDLLGVRQHGIPALKIGNPVKDLELLKTARAEAENLLTKFPADELKKKFLKGVFTDE